MKIAKIIIYAIAFISFFAAGNNTIAADLRGKIFLQVESHGEAWYVDPSDNKRYYLGRPQDAFNAMKELGLGISSPDFDKYFNNPPLRLYGRILLKVQDKGRAYYVDPRDKKFYYLGRPDDAFGIMRSRGIGITNADLQKIIIGQLSSISGLGPNTVVYQGQVIDLSLLETKIQKLANAKRAAKGLSELKQDAELALLARSHSRDMADNGYFSNTDPAGCSTVCRFDNSDYLYKKIAESIATGYVYKFKYTDGTTSGVRPLDEVAESIVNVWVNNRFIFDDTMVNQGVGLSGDSNGKIFVTNDLSIPLLTAGQENELRTFTAALVADLHDQSSKVAKIHSWITGNIAYDIENYLKNSVPDASFSPYGTFKNRKGVCQGYAELMRVMLRFVNIRSGIVSGRSDSTLGFMSHAWLKLNLGGEELYIDPTWDAGFIKDNVFVKKPVITYYLITGKCIAVDHATGQNNAMTVTEQKQYVEDNLAEFNSRCPELKAKILSK